MNKKLWNSQSGLLEYVLQYYDLTTQRNHIFNRNAFSSLILCYVYTLVENRSGNHRSLYNGILPNT